MKKVESQGLTIADTLYGGVHEASIAQVTEACGAHLHPSILFLSNTILLPLHDLQHLFGPSEVQISNYKNQNISV